MISFVKVDADGYNSNGVNAEIKAHILEDEKMRDLGFTDYNTPYWYFSKVLSREISFNLMIPKDGSDIRIDVIDEAFGQPYDYQYILAIKPDSEYALSIQEKVERCMKYLADNGVLEGHEGGYYI